MAFIKDDVGNWSLKSFDNDPENLLKAYTNFSIETIKKAAEIAANGMAPGAIEGSKSAAKAAQPCHKDRIWSSRERDGTQITDFDSIKKSIACPIESQE